MTKSEMTASFERVQAQLKARVGAEVYSSWFGRLKLAEASKSVVRMSVPTPFLRAWISNHYSDLLSELWLAEVPALLKIEVVVRTAQRAGTETPAVTAETPKPAATAMSSKICTTKSAGTVSADQPRDPAVGTALDPRYTFASFVEGPANRVAYAAARTVAESGSGAVRFNPLFIHATVGLGKTHLVAGDCLRSHAAQSARPSRLFDCRVFHVALCLGYP